jgi:hypothetical protein
MRRAVLKKNLDKGETPPYPTPSMSSPLSPEMLNRGFLSTPGPKGGISKMAAKKKAAKKGGSKKKK